LRHVSQSHESQNHSLTPWAADLCQAILQRSKDASCTKLAQRESAQLSLEDDLRRVRMAQQ